jgi:hypothetical protein
MGSAAQAQTQTNSWLRDYRDASRLVERAAQTGTDRGMREVLSVTSELADTARNTFPDGSKMVCSFAALNLGSVARSLRDNRLMSVERDLRLWKETDAKCVKALPR